jgi:hypothetical protein
MAIKVFPSANGVGEAGQKVLSEGNLAGWMLPGARNYVISGLKIPESVTGPPFAMHITAGAAVIAGYYVVADAPIGLQLPEPTLGPQRCYIYLRLLRDGIGLVNSVQPHCVEVRGTDPLIPPAGDCIYLGYVSSGGMDYSRGTNVAPYTPWLSIADTLRPGSMYYATFFDSVDGFTTAGTVIPGEQHIALTTAATSGASATLRKKLPDTMHIDTSRPYAIRMGIGYSSYNAITGYAGIGTPASKQFVGISYRDGYIYGCHGDGSSLVETEELSTSGGGNTSADKEICIEAADGKIVWQATRGRMTDATTCLPTYLGDRAMLYAEVRTSAAAAKTMWLSHWMVGQFA